MELKRRSFEDTAFLMTLLGALWLASAISPEVTRAVGPPLGTLRTTFRALGKGRLLIRAALRSSDVPGHDCMIHRHNTEG